MKLKLLALVCLVTFVRTAGPAAEEEDDSDEHHAHDLVAKFVKKRPTYIDVQQHIVLNPRDCYVSMTLFPLDFYIDLEKLIIRLRLISNCFPTRDIVLISRSNFPKEPTQLKHPKAMKLTIFRDEWEFKFKGPKAVRQEGHFSKVRYTKVMVKSQNLNGKVYINQPNFMEIDTRLSDLNLYRLRQIKSPIECPLDGKLKYMICRLF